MESESSLCSLVHGPQYFEGSVAMHGSGSSLLVMHKHSVVWYSLVGSPYDSFGVLFGNKVVLHSKLSIATLILTVLSQCTAPLCIGLSTVSLTGS